MFNDDFDKSFRAFRLAFVLVALGVVAFWTTVIVVGILVLKHFGIL